MTKEEILEYKVLEYSKRNKDFFNDLLGKGKIQILGDYKNEHGELFVVFKTDILGSEASFITGDEFDWSMGYEVTEKGDVFTRFYLTKEETEPLINILKANYEQ